MDITQIVIWSLIGLIFVFGIAPTFIMSFFIYRELFIRKNPDKRERRCSFPEDEEYVKMYNEGCEWGRKNDYARHSVAIENDGMHLYGEYFDFGFQRTVIIIPGRTEDCTYSYYFSEPYKMAGCNVLCIDNRSHGLSDGKRHNLGATEYRDILKWSELLVTEFGNKSVILHGICIGASVALYVLVSENCPSYIEGMVTEGMYTTFKDSFDEHMKEGKHPRFPFTLEVMAWIRILSKANVLTDGPKKRIGRLTRPILMLHSREDAYSLPSQGEWLYEHCNAPKRIVWFDKGIHSRIRPRNEEKFDKVIAEFVEELSK